MAKKKSYFVVWAGRIPGIYTSWEDCKRQVDGFTSARYKGFVSEVEAVEAFGKPFDECVSMERKQVAGISGVLFDRNNLPEMRRWVTPAICVDAACSGNPGDMEYRGVDLTTGKEIFRQGPYPQGTNNIGEFLAIVHGLAFLKKYNSAIPVYSDSVTAIAWVRGKKAKTVLKETPRNSEIFELISRAESWLRNNSYPNSVLKWETNAWGEIPADFGRK